MTFSAWWLNSLALLSFLLLCIFVDPGTAESWPEEVSNLKRDKRSDIEPAVIGGLCAREHELPWIVSINYPDEHGNYKHICGASIIHKRLILTAAHCLYDLGTDDMLDTTKIKIRGGSNMPHTSSIVGVDYIIPFPGYNNLRVGKNYLQNDIALIRFPRNLLFKESVGPIELPSDNQSVDPGTLLRVAGWGFTEKNSDESNRKIPDCLQKAKVTVIPTSDCTNRLHKFNVTDKMICIDSTVTDICQGDSGGALYKTITEGGATKHQIFGVISGSSKGCGGNNGASVFTKVTDYLRWIRRAIRQCDREGGY